MGGGYESVLASAAGAGEGLCTVGFNGGVERMEELRRLWKCGWGEEGWVDGVWGGWMAHRYICNLIRSVWISLIMKTTVIILFSNSLVFFLLTVLAAHSLIDSFTYSTPPSHQRHSQLNDLSERLEREDSE